MVEENGKAVYIFSKTGDLAVKADVRIGKRLPLHTTAAGKAILANVPEQAVNEIVERNGLPQLTPASISNKEDLKSELEMIDKSGVSYNREESIEGIWAIAVPLKNANSGVVGALSLSGPKQRIKKKADEYEDELRNSANELEINLRY